MSKQYGLIIPDKQGAKKPAPIFSASKNVFGDDSDEEEVGVPKAPLRTGEKLKRQARIVQEKALEEDPTIYQYDELYDDIEEKKKVAKQSVQKEEKKPRYIEKLLITAEKRKRENERRVERQVQKEREEEGDKFADKESFVTSAYKKKLEEMQQDEEKQRREDYLEEIGDVTKQADLGGFYRHLYEQKLRPEKQRPDIHASTSTIKEEKTDDIKVEKPDKLDKVKRSYRKRNSSGDTPSGSKDHESGSDDEVNRPQLGDDKASKKQRTHLQSNIDADSDFSIDSSSDENENEDEEKSKSKKKDELPEQEAIPEVKIEKQNDSDNFKKPTDVKPVIKNVDKEEVKEVKVKPKIDIWKKRTVGEKFDEALMRYYARKASKA